MIRDITLQNSTSEQQLLTNEEMNILRGIRNKRTFFVLSTYLGLCFVLVESWIYIFDDLPYWGLQELFRFRFFLSQFILLLFIALTGFFLHYYFKIVNPFVKDIHAGKKEIVTFEAGRYKTPFFSDYYLETPLKKNSLVKITQEIYDEVGIDPSTRIHFSPIANYVLLIEIAGRKMKFNGSNALIDL